MFENAKWICQCEWTKWDFPKLPAPYVVRDFNVKKGVKKATLNICAIGQGAFFVNGKRIPDSVIPTQCTTYEKAVAYNTYDITAVFPVAQQFMTNATFAQNVSPMVAVTENRSSYEMKFKNVGSWLNLYVKGDKKISKVVMKAKNDKIAGEYIVTASNTADPVVTVSEDGINKIVLTCGEEGVQLSNDKATVFTFTTVPFEFEAGEVSFDIYDTEGNYIPDAYVINQASKF